MPNLIQRGSNANAWFARKIMNQHNSVSSFSGVIRKINKGKNVYDKRKKECDLFICGKSKIDDGHVCGA
jgi:hypothetical protein